MRQTLLLPLFLSLAGPALGQSATEVIDAQIEALRLGDYETAFTFAAPALHEIFGTPAISAA